MPKRECIVLSKNKSETKKKQPLLPLAKRIRGREEQSSKSELLTFGSRNCKACRRGSLSREDIDLQTAAEYTITGGINRFVMNSLSDGQSIAAIVPQQYLEPIKTRAPVENKQKAPSGIDISSQSFVPPPRLLQQKSHFLNQHHHRRKNATVTVPERPELAYLIVDLQKPREERDSHKETVSRTISES